MEQARPLTEAIGSSMPRDAAEELARSLRAVADPTRLQLLSILLDTADGRATIGELAEALDVSQPTATHHVKILDADGFITRAREKKYVWISIAADRRPVIEDLLQ